MIPATQPDPEWVAMRAQHQQECAAFARQVSTDSQALIQRQDMERVDLHNRVDTIKAELLLRHKQQEGAYWARFNQKQSKICGPAVPLPPTLQQGDEPAAKATKLRPSAIPATVPDRKPMPKPKPAAKPLRPKDSEQHKVGVQKLTVTSAVQQCATQPSQPALLPRHIQRQPKMEAGSSQLAKPRQPKRDATASRARAISKKVAEMIDLYDSDEDMLVELSKEDYQKKTRPTVTLTPFCPAIPTATLQLFSGPSQKQMVSSKTYLGGVHC